MNTNYNITIPSPILREPRFIDEDRSDTVLINAHNNDRLNLTTGEFHVARMIDGRRWDTSRAIPVIGGGSNDVFIRLTRLYRLSRSEFFTLYFTWSQDTGLGVGPMITPVDYFSVFDTVKRLIEPGDIFAYLRDWHLPGWMPYDCGEAQAWAEGKLSADQYERLFAAEKEDPIDVPLERRE